MNNLLDCIPGLKKKNESEYCGPCPWCGGTDRFIVWPKQQRGGRFLCRKCEKKGDAIDFLRAQGLTFAEAQDCLGLEAEESTNQRHFLGHLGGLGVGPRVCQIGQVLNRTTWIDSAANFLQKSINHTESTVLNDWHRMLIARHLTVETAIRFKIGWNPYDFYVEAKSWGIIDDSKLKIPKGLIIPTYQAECVSAIKIRRCTPDPRYWQIRGSKRMCLILGEKGMPTIIVESELDAYLIWQESNNQAAVIALGGCQKSIDERALNFLSAAPRILISMDFDDRKDDGSAPGQSAYLNLRKQFPNAEYFPTATGKDPTEMQTSGIPVRQWIGVALGGTNYSGKGRLPKGFPGTWQWFVKSIEEFPHLVPCPKTAPVWGWKYRADCSNCLGHINCVKDL